MKLTAGLFLLCAALCPLVHAQTTTTVTAANPGPDESISPDFVAQQKECRALLAQRSDPAAMVAACKKVADAASQFPPQSHFITRRSAYVGYMTALIYAKQFKQAIAVGDKAVAIVLLGHDDASGSSAAYGVRGEAKALAGDLAGADRDLEKAELFERNGLKTPAGQALQAEYSRALKGLLTLHAQVLVEMGRKSEAANKRDEASKL
jgi:tetratricopeptide (TPR) repeat protein